MIFKRLTALAALAIAVFVLAAPAARAQFIEQQVWGGTSAGSANAQTLRVENMAAPVPGVPVRFVAGFTNTGPMTINIDNFGPISVLRPSSIGNVGLSGNEIFFGELVTIVYMPGGFYILASNIDMTPIGKTVEYRGAATPRGTLIEDGSCVSQTTYAALFSVIGTAYGSCSAGQFALPDSRGTLFAALDNQGVNGPANRITSAVSGCNATAIGQCGSQSVTLQQGQLPNVTLAVSGSIPSLSIPPLLIPSLSVTSAFNNNAINIPIPLQGNWQGGGGFPVTSAFSGGNSTGGATFLNVGGNSATIAVNGSTGAGITGTGATGAGSLSGGVTAALGSGNAVGFLPPVLVGRRAIKY